MKGRGLLMTRRQRRMILVFAIITSIIITILGILMLGEVGLYLLNSWDVSQYANGRNWASQTTQLAYQKAMKDLLETEGWLYTVLLKGSRLCRWCIGISTLAFTFGPTIFWIYFFGEPEKTKTNR